MNISRVLSEEKGAGYVLTVQKISREIDRDMKRNYNQTKN